MKHLLKPLRFTAAVFFIAAVVCINDIGNTNSSAGIKNSCLNLEITVSAEPFEGETSDPEQTAESEEITDTGNFSDTETTDYRFDEKYIEDKLNGYRYVFPDGYYWNLGGVSTCPCSNGTGTDKCNFYSTGALVRYFYTSDATQCHGFAAMISDMLFGKDAPISTVSSFDELRPGDVIRFENLEHTLMVLSKHDDYITVVECNANYRDCIINWYRKVTKSTFEASDTICITRYPAENSDGTSMLGFVTWQAPLYSEKDESSCIITYAHTWPNLCIINSSDPEWYYVSTADGSKGYIRKDLVTISWSLSSD